MMDIIAQAKNHLAVAIGQSIPADDQIIMDHVKAAYTLLGALGPHHHVAGTTVSQHIDKCALCGLDLRDDIHLRRTIDSGTEAGEIASDEGLPPPVKPEFDDLVEALSALIEWHDRVEDGNDGVHYLNGDSDKYPGDGWSHVTEIAERARALIARIETTGDGG